jgi:hypothetical protein
MRHFIANEHTRFAAAFATAAAFAALPEITSAPNPLTMPSRPPGAGFCGAIHRALYRQIIN